MLQIRLIAVGNLKESYWREALAEYGKRISAYARFEVTELKESRLPESPDGAAVSAALEKEADAILAAVPPRAALFALCVEGTQFSSEELAAKIETVAKENGTLALAIGSSHGLSPRVKAAADLRLSVSKLTFPHQMMRVVLAETLYRSLSISHGGKYHK